MIGCFLPMTEVVVRNFLRRSGVIVNEDAAITCAILGQPTKVATNAGLALAREALKAQRDAIVAMEKRAAEAAASHGTTPRQAAETPEAIQTTKSSGSSMRRRGMKAK